MGFENRDYYREDEGGGFTLTGGIGTACKTLIAINIAVFLLQIISMSGGMPALNRYLQFDAQALMSGQIWRVLTWGFGFQGDNPLGFIFDMLFIWWFGKSLESMYGTRELLLYYGAAILVGSVIGLVFRLATGNNVTLIGSSIPSMAITVLFAWHFPYRQILLFFLIPVPIFAIVALYVVMNLFSAAASGASGGSFMAGLGGVAFGLLYGWQEWRIEKWLPGRGFKVSLPRRKPDLRVFEPEEDNDVDREVDRILAKIHDQGEGSLTDQERKTLQQASRRYRR